MPLLRQPLTINYDEFEQLMLSMASEQYELKKRPVATVEEFLGSFMDKVFRTSGVLVDYPQD